MPRLLDQLTDLFKKADAIDHALRYNAVFYGPICKVLRELDSMDRGARRTLFDYLTQRMLDWAARLPDGVPRVCRCTRGRWSRRAICAYLFCRHKLFVEPCPRR